MIIKIFENLYIKEVVPYFIFHHLKKKILMHVSVKEFLIDMSPSSFNSRKWPDRKHTSYGDYNGGGGGGADNLLSILANLRM